MTNEIVKYGNRLNEIPLRHFNSREMNLLMSIVSRIHEKGTDEITFSFEQLRALSQYKDHGERFVKELDSTYSKLISLNAYTDDGHTLTRFVAFNRYQIDRDNQEVRIAVNPDFKGIFNQLAQWARFSLEQFAHLNSTYAKSMFRLLKQYRTAGTRNFTMEDFRTLLDIPKSYRVNHIDQVVIKPIKEELSPIFKGLSIRKLRKGRGGKIVGYSFSWKAETKEHDDFSKGVWDEKIALDNIKYNSELTKEEKFRATDKVKGIRLGTTAKEQQAEADRSKKEADENRSRQELLNGLHNINGH